MSQAADCQSRSEGSTDAFPSTQWSLILEAATGDEPSSREALGRLCVLYREPIRTWLLRTGTRPEMVDDLTQRFVEHLLSANRLTRVEQRETKFRTFLIECLRRLVRGEWRKEMAAKRGGGIAVEPLDDQVGAAPPEFDRLLDRDFAVHVHRRAMARLENRSTAEPRRTRFVTLQRFTGAVMSTFPMRRLARPLA